MWPEIQRQLARFPSAVLTSLDPGGFPYSLRCVPQPDDERQRLRIEIPPGTAVQPGPASILCHGHDEKLWGMKSFLIRGRLEREGESWSFLPDRFLPGMGPPWAMAGNLIRARRTANRILARRQHPRPKIDWAAVRALRRQARRRGATNP